jgi:hypothetical protein
MQMTSRKNDEGRPPIIVLMLLFRSRTLEILQLEARERMPTSVVISMCFSLSV